MAPSSFILITLFSLAMVASITEARMVRSQLAKDEAMVEAIEDLIMHGEPTSLSSKKSDCHTSSDSQKEKAFVRDFEPRPNISAYPDDAKLKGDQTTFIKDFEPRPQISANPTDDDAGKKAIQEDFEPRPNVSAYQG